MVGWGVDLRRRSARPCAGCAAQGRKVAHAHLRHLNPFPANTGAVLQRFKRVLVPEMNMGQLRMLLRAEYLVDAQGYNQVPGQPFDLDRAGRGRSPPTSRSSAA